MYLQANRPDKKDAINAIINPLICVVFNVISAKHGPNGLNTFIFKELSSAFSVIL